MSEAGPHPNSHGLIARWLKLLGVNRTILLAGGPRFAGMVLGPVGSIIIVYTLSTAQQGMYYVFLSLLGLRTFFELGATACIGQLTPHYLGADGRTPSSAMVEVAGRWMRNVAIAFGTFALAIGLAYLGWCGYDDWWTQFLWVAAVLPTALTGIQEGRLQLLYGAGLVDEVSKIRWWAVLFQYLVQWSLLLLGAGLLSFFCAALAVVIGQEWRLRRAHAWLFRSRTPSEPGMAPALGKELGKLIRRASIVYLAGYFVLQIQQPILFRWAGAEASARFGFSLMILNSLIGTASLWGMTTFPAIARLVADGKILDGYRRFRGAWWRAVAVATLALTAAAAAAEILRLIPRFQDRLLPLIGLLPLGAAVWIQNVVNGATYWPRAFKQEPFAPAAVLQMAITPPLVWAIVHWFGADSIGWANLISWIAGGTLIFLITAQFLPGRRRALEFAPGEAKNA
jgi:hypothetical protein